MTNCNLCGGTTVFISSGIVKCEYCGRLYSTSNGELNAADPERLYSNAVSMSKSSNEDTLKSAIETFEALGSYKDSSALANSCRGMIAQSRVEAEERRLAAERQAELDRIESEKRSFEEKQKAKIRGIVIAAVSAVAVLVVAISIISNSNKVSSYNKAMELYSMGQYEEARAAFSDLGDYSDAATYVSTIDNFLTERESKYERGISYYEKGAYSECITSLADISGYLDSEDYVEKSVEAIYQQATECYDAGEFEKAKELLGKIPDSSSKNMDAELLLTDIEETIIAQTNAANYEKAKEYYDNGDYETAQRLFISLGNYEDSATYLSAIGTSYYEKASNLFNQKEYVQCEEILQYIDAVEEWGEYDKTQELLKSTKEEYQALVYEAAKQLCRSEGYSAMCNYIDGSICGLLDELDASSMKEKGKEYIPVKLTEIYVMTENLKHKDELSNAKDIFQNEYEYGLEYSYISSQRYTVDKGYHDIDIIDTYLLNGEFSKFTATLTPSESWRREGNGGEKYGTVIFTIYGDGIQLYSTSLWRTTNPKDIDIDVSGIERLEIAFRGGNDAEFCLLANPYLSK